MGMRKIFATALASLAVVGWAGSANAIVNLPVPDNAYITVSDLNWAWAAPCAAIGDSCGAVDLTYQGTQGWRLPTPAEFALHPLAAAFIFAGGNVPFGGSDGAGNNFAGGAPGAGACAAAYFSPSYTHCDWSDGESGYWFDPAAGAGQGLYESLLVRDAVDGPVSGVPEPATWAMMILGFFGLGAALRDSRRRKPLTAAA